MATAKQIAAAKRNIKKAQDALRKMSRTGRMRTLPHGSGSKTPGIYDERKFFRIGVRPRSDFVTFRIQDVGEPGGIERLAGKRASGSWDTVSWLVNKDFAHIEGDQLVADHSEAKELFDTLGSLPKHVKGNLFIAKDRPNVP